MSLMYEVNTINAAMIQAAEVCRQDMPEAEKVNAVLACFAGMKPVEAELVVHAWWDSGSELLGYHCSACGADAPNDGFDNGAPYCYWCGARMDGGAADAP